MAPSHTNPTHEDHQQTAPQIAYLATAQMPGVRLDLNQFQLRFDRHQY
jgi:hypothetical protein